MADYRFLIIEFEAGENGVSGTDIISLEMPLFKNPLRAVLKKAVQLRAFTIYFFNRRTENENKIIYGN